VLTKEQNRALLEVGNASLGNPEWTSYADYCFAKEKGLRKEALSHLERFLQEASKWNFDERISFVQFLFYLMDKVDESDNGPFPNPLSEKLVKPTLEVWCSIEAEDPRPFRWYGKTYRSKDHMLRALEIDPADDRARLTLLGWTDYIMPCTICRRAI
jgi:hypothetical protein